VAIDLLETLDKKLYQGEIKSIFMFASEEEVQLAVHREGFTMKTPKEKTLRARPCI
jgi:hypothetical protein